MGINDSMKTSKEGLEFIARWEGCVLKPYKDIAGLRTIGIGHLIKPGEDFPDGVEITKEKAMEILSSDVQRCEESIKLRIKVPLNQNQFDALVSFGFNCGTGVYALADACKALNEGKYEEVPEKLLSWSKVRINGVLQTNKGLYSRRLSEGQLFSKPMTTSVINEKKEKVIVWDKSSIKVAQTCLKSLNLYSLKIDGVWGPGTSNGLKSFAEKNMLNLGDSPEKQIPESVMIALKSASGKK